MDGRPRYCKAGTLTYKEAAARLRVSRQRLMAADPRLASSVRAWRLWAACAELTAGYSKAADKVYVVRLANMANVQRQVASRLLREFDAARVFTWRKAERGRGMGLLALPRRSADGVAAAGNGTGKCPRCGGLARRLVTALVPRYSYAEGGVTQWEETDVCVACANECVELGKRPRCEKCGTPLEEDGHCNPCAYFGRIGPAARGV